MIKPTRKLDNNEDCTILTIRYTTTKDYILTAVCHIYYDEYYNMQSITRNKIEETLLYLLEVYGSAFFDNSDNQISHSKSRTKEGAIGLATKLFPDWFCTQSVQYILDEEN